VFIDCPFSLALIGLLDEDNVSTKDEENCPNVLTADANLSILLPDRLSRLPQSKSLEISD